MTDVFWTKKRPTSEGHWPHQKRKKGAISVVKLFRYVDGSVFGKDPATGDYIKVQNMHGWWSSAPVLFPERYEEI